MRAAIALLAGAAAVRAAPAAQSAQPSQIAPLSPSESVIPVFVTRAWPLLSPSQALDNLASKAKATPSAVSALPGVDLPEEVLSKVSQHAYQVIDNIIGHQVQKTQAVDSDEPFNHLSGDLEERGTCTNPAVRYEWRDLTVQHQQQYVAAIKCLTERHTILNCPPCNTVYDDLIYIHQQMSNIIHNVGQFLTWHRYYVWIFQNLLSSQCGYNGPLAWWDETKDAGHFDTAPPFTSTYEGSMPDGNAQCITNGVFANMVLPIGPGSSETRHCLARGVNETLSSAITSNFVNTCNSYSNFEDMNNCVFFGPHAYGHDAVGGIMSDVQSSPGDPAFFLHHGFIDRNYRIWQNMDTSRDSAIGGYTTQNCGSSCTPTTLNYVLSSMGLSQSLPISDVVYTEGGALCYKYNY